jgi:hypothetical protein
MLKNLYSELVCFIISFVFNHTSKSSLELSTMEIVDSPSDNSGEAQYCFLFADSANNVWPLLEVLLIVGARVINYEDS